MGRKVSTKRKAGTAMSGCGRLENTLHRTARQALTPRGTSTRLMARPSGMLWKAIDAVIKAPKASPPPKATPTPTPSAKECRVMTPTIRIILVASARETVPSASAAGPCACGCS